MAASAVTSDHGTTDETAPGGRPRQDGPRSSGPARGGPVPGWTERRTLSVVLVLAGSVPVLVALVGLVTGWHPSGASALVSLRVDALLHGHFPMAGMPATGEQLGGGVLVDQPGPAALYLLAPFVLLFGPVAGIALGAAAINSFALMVSCWAAFRRGGVFFAAMTGCFLCLLIRGLGPYSVIDPVGSSLGTLPFIAFVLVTWSILSGERRQLPLAVLLGSFTLQAHLTFLAIGGAVTVVLIAGVVTQGLSGGDRWPDHRARRWSGLIAVVFWLPVLFDQLVSSGNLTSILRMVTSGTVSGAGPGYALGRLWVSVGLPPLFLRSAHGFTYLQDAGPITALTALAVLAGLVVAAVVPYRGRLVDPSLRAYGAVVGAALLGAITSTTVLAPVAMLKPQNLQWMWSLGMLVWLGLAWALVRLALKSRRPTTREVVPASLGILVLAVLVAVVPARSLPNAEARLAPTVTKLSKLASDAQVDTYRVVYRGGPASQTLGPAFAYRLATSGSTVFVDAGTSTQDYGSGNAYNGQPVNATYLVATGAHPKLPTGYQVVFRTAFPARPGAPDQDQVVVGLRPGPSGPAVPAACRSFMVLQDAVAPLAQSGGATRGELATMLAGLDVGRFTDLGLTADQQAKVDQLAADRDALVAALRTHPDDEVDAATVTALQGHFPNLQSAVTGITAMGDLRDECAEPTK